MEPINIEPEAINRLRHPIASRPDRSVQRCGVASIKVIRVARRAERTLRTRLAVVNHNRVGDSKPRPAKQHGVGTRFSHRQRFFRQAASRSDWRHSGVDFVQSQSLMAMPPLASMAIVLGQELAPRVP
jgi:hypothetical protein